MAKSAAFRPIIFISHSARKDPETHEQLALIRAALDKAGFDVLLDETRLKGGEPWRNCLHTWMGHCHGAIVLLTKKALQSDWVLKESTILSWRKSLNADFMLVPVFLGISDADVRASERFAPLDITEIQAVKKLAGRKLATKLPELLKPLKALGADTPRRVLEQKISNLLYGIRAPALLMRVTKALGEDLGGWGPDHDVQDRVAMLLLQAPPETLAGALGCLAGAVPKESMTTIAEILNVNWINPETAGMLMVASQKPPGRRAGAINISKHEFTTRALVGRASGQYPAWPFIAVADGGGEDTQGAVIAQVRAALERYTKTKDPRVIDLFLERFEKKRRPVLVVFPPPEGDRDLLEDKEIQEVMNQFKRCTLLILTGDSMPPAGRLANVLRLAPAFETDEEAEAYVGWIELCQSAGIMETP